MARFRRMLGMMDVTDVGNVLHRTHAMIELTPDRVVRTANKQFLTTLGYSLRSALRRRRRKSRA